MTEHRNGKYYYCKDCRKIYVDSKMQYSIARVKTNPLPFVIRGMIKESKLCKRCKEDD